ncbi:glycosyl transferase [Virgibacillus dakarensis]|nr:glycosyl transferase [Virgibacillus dakarensis]
MFQLGVVKIFNKIKKALLDPKLLLLYLLKYRLFRAVPDDLFVRLEYRLKMNKKLNLKNPKSFNEKLQWLKLNDLNPLYTNLVDKYKVREYVKEKIGEKYLVPIVGVYDKVDEIPFHKLLGNYVLKCTHDSGTVIIKNNSFNLSLVEVKQKLNKALSRNYYYEHREWPYKNVKPRVICEKLIKTKNGTPPRDYKIFCFNGEPKLFFVASDRNNGGTKFDFFDLEWNKYPFKQHYPNSNYLIKKPKKWDEMLTLARKLSEGFIHVRVDFYLDSEDSIFFGELTFYHFSGIEKFEPDEYDFQIGKLLELPSK